MKNTKKIVIGLVIILAAVIYLLSAGFSDVKTHVALETLVAEGETYRGKMVQTEGRVIGDSVNWDAAAVRLTFQISGMADGSVVIPVLYLRPIPENFQDATEVLVSGTYLPGGEFQAEELITKCPSKYETAAE